MSVVQLYLFRTYRCVRGRWRVLMVFPLHGFIQEGLQAITYVNTRT